MMRSPLRAGSRALLLCILPELNPSFPHRALKPCTYLLIMTCETLLTDSLLIHGGFSLNNNAKWGLCGFMSVWGGARRGRQLNIYPCRTDRENVLVKRVRCSPNYNRDNSNLKYQRRRHHWNSLTLMLHVFIDFSFKKNEDIQTRVDESKFSLSFTHDLQGWSDLGGGESWGTD